MGKIAAGNNNVSTVLPRDIVSLIDQRRKGQSMTRSKFVSLIVSKWYEQGAVPVNDADRAVMHMKQLEKTLPAPKAEGKAGAVARKAS